jgi:hypothetical protein
MSERPDLAGARDVRNCQERDEPSGQRTSAFGGKADFGSEVAQVAV